MHSNRLSSESCSVCAGACAWYASETVEVDVKTFIMNGHETPHTATTHSKTGGMRPVWTVYIGVDELDAAAAAAATGCCYTTGDHGKGWYTTPSLLCRNETYMQ